MNASPIVPENQRRTLQVPQSSAGRNPVLFVWWDAADDRDESPCARHLPHMAVNGTPLNVYLSDAIDRMLAHWRRLPCDRDWTDAFLSAKQACLQAIRHGLTAVYRPGVDAGYIAVATALCANAVRTITLLSEAALDPALCDTAIGTREFKLSRAFAGLTRYKPGALPSTMLPFGGGRRIAAVKRQAPSDPRLLANIFACDVDAVQAAQELTKQKLREPARAMCA